MALVDALHRGRAGGAGGEGWGHGQRGQMVGKVLLRACRQQVIRAICRDPLAALLSREEERHLQLLSSEHQPFKHRAG